MVSCCTVRRALVGWVRTGAVVQKTGHYLGRVVIYRGLNGAVSTNPFRTDEAEGNDYSDGDRIQRLKYNIYFTPSYKVGGKILTVIFLHIYG